MEGAQVDDTRAADGPPARGRASHLVVDAIPSGAGVHNALGVGQLCPGHPQLRGLLRRLRSSYGHIYAREAGSRRILNGEGVWSKIEHGWRRLRGLPP